MSSQVGIHNPYEQRDKAPQYERKYWKDNIASLANAKTTGANQPVWTQVGSSGIYAYAFAAGVMKELWSYFHINHDFAKGSKIFPHIHWCPSDNSAGVVRWGIEWTYAKGHGQQAFPATETIYIEQAAGEVVDLHQIAEAAIADALDGDTLGIETDGMILMRFFRDAAHANDTYGQDAYAFTVDLHYQADKYGTVSKAPDFDDDSN